MHAAVKSRQDADRAKRSPQEELNAYLTSPLENVENIVAWWGVSTVISCSLISDANLCFQHHASQYPTLARMARDYLAIQGSAVPSERAFSSGGLSATQRRNQLSPALFESLQLLKSAYQNGHLKAADEAVAHLNTLLDGFDELDFADDEKEVL
jgi:hAT family C-terminal dimerisation region